MANGKRRAWGSLVLLPGKPGPKGGQFELSKHPGWMGDAALPASVRARGNRIARKLYPKLPEVCETPGCIRAAAVRHHIDNNTMNNDRSNLAFICQPCHLQVDNPNRRRVAA